MANNSDEPMDVDVDVQNWPLPSSSLAQHSQNTEDDEDVAELKVSLTTAEEIEPKKFKRVITITLQKWANKNSISGEFEASEISEDGKTAVIKVRPAEALRELLNMSRIDLNTKEEKKFSLTPIKQEEDEKDDKKSPPDFSSLQHRKELSGSVNLSGKDSSADEDNDKPHVALGPYWYMKNFHPDKIQQIERENGVKITEDVVVSINAKSKRADRKKATDDFIRLVQSCLSESNGLSIPLKKVGPEEWKDTLKLLKSTDHKCQITISSDQITIFGPQQFQTAISKSLQQTKISTNLTDEERIDDYGKANGKNYNHYGEERRMPKRNKFKIDSSIKDPLVSDGLPVDEYYWEILTNQNRKDLRKIEEKFNVRFKDSENALGEKVVRVRYSNSGRNMQMESHAIRALQRLYQKVATSHFLKNNGIFNVDGAEEEEGEDLYTAPDERKGANGKTGPAEEKSSGRGSTQGGAEAKKKEKEETCPVCLDSFTKKTQLKNCKHEFCEECLEQSVKAQGAICPMCKDVFGIVTGDQPDGNMRVRNIPISLPGYNHCGTIEISYDIPSGTQTAKHPNPGRHYHGINRRAYLPDTREGNEVLQLLKKAFNQKLIFTVGTSRTTGEENVVTWNDIHHKTSQSGGPESFGYPDANYLSRVKEELKAKGIK